jgi:hypothetical protein
VVHAPDRIAFAPALGQRGTTVSASVRKRDQGTTCLPKEAHWFPKQRSAEELLTDHLLTPRGDVPAIANKHIHHRHLVSLVHLLAGTLGIVDT